MVAGDEKRSGVSRIALTELPGRPCPIAAALEVVGERWSLLIIRELLLGSTRFSDIVAGTGGPRDRITARLRALEKAGVIRRTAYQSAPQRFDYHLTESGHALRPILEDLIEWGLEHAVRPSDAARYRRRTARRPERMT